MCSQPFSIFLRFPDGESSSSGSVDDTGLDGGTFIISRSDSVGSPGFGSACALIDSWSAEDIVDDPVPDGPGGVSPFISSYPESVNDAGLGGGLSGLDTSDGSSGIEGSGCLTSVHPSAGPDGRELDEVKKELGGWPKRSSHCSFNPWLGPGSAWSGLDSGDGSLGIEGSRWLTSVPPSIGPDGRELDDGENWPSGWPKRSSHSSFNLSLGPGDAWSGLDSGDGSSGIEGSGCLTSVHPSAGSNGAELNDSSGLAEWSSGTPKSVSTNLSNSSPRFPNMLIMSSGM